MKSSSLLLHFDESKGTRQKDHDLIKHNNKLYSEAKLPVITKVITIEDRMNNISG